MGEGALGLIKRVGPVLAKTKNVERASYRWVLGVGQLASLLT